MNESTPCHACGGSLISTENNRVHVYTLCVLQELVYMLVVRTAVNKVNTATPLARWSTSGTDVFYQAVIPFD